MRTEEQLREDSEDLNHVLWTLGWLLGMVETPDGDFESSADEMVELINKEVETLRTRLRLAEDVCALFGWMAIDDSVKGKAATQAWMEWAAHPEVSTDPRDWPHLNDYGIARLAAIRDEVRKRTLERLTGNE